MKKLALVMAIAGALYGFTAFGQGPNGLAGVEVSAEALSNLGPNTFLAVISDNTGRARVVRVNRETIPDGSVALRVISEDGAQGGCFVRIDGEFVWINPCPH